MVAWMVTISVTTKKVWSQLWSLKSWSPFNFPFEKNKCASEFSVKEVSLKIPISWMFLNK